MIEEVEQLFLTYCTLNKDINDEITKKIKLKVNRIEEIVKRIKRKRSKHPLPVFFHVQ